MKIPYLRPLERDIIRNYPESKLAKRIRDSYEAAKSRRQCSEDIDKALYTKEIVDFIKNAIHYLEGWKSLKKTPPNEKVEVLFSDGNIGTANPTYCPFYFETMDGDEKKSWGWRNTPVFYEDGLERWDGGWAIEIEFKDISREREIVKWRRL